MEAAVMVLVSVMVPGPCDGCGCGRSSWIWDQCFRCGHVDILIWRMRER